MLFPKDFRCQLGTGHYQYFISLIIIIGIAIIGYAVQDIISYRAVALLLLMAVSLLAMRFDIWPVLMAATISALIWNFFFIPPRFTFHIRETEDILLFLMYFLIALLNAVLTHKIRMNERTARDREEKAKAIQLYNALFNSLSHELRTPITTIMGATDTLKEQGDQLSPATQQVLISEIGIAGNRLNQQVQDLLQMSRIESGMLRIQKDWSDITDIMASVKQHLPAEQLSRIRFDPHHPLPLFNLDISLITQAVLTIVQNALQYSSADSPVLITVRYQDEACQVLIADQGPGIAANETQQVFQPFYRMPNSQAGGTGLGLSIAKGFIEAHDGTITIAPHQPKGSVFTINIPAPVSFINQLKHE